MRLFKKTQIDNVPELERELKKTYDRTDPDTIHEYLAQEDHAVNGVTHTIKGCSDCPFVRPIVDLDTGESSTFCLWDPVKRYIQKHVDSMASTPDHCMLREQNLTIRYDNGN